MAGRRRNPVRLFCAFVTLALAVFALATAPALAIGAEIQPQALAMSEMATTHDGACAGMDANCSPSHGAHGAHCLAACLSAHGAVLPEMPAARMAWRAPDAVTEIAPGPEFPDHPFGLDPPPPRSA